MSDEPRRTSALLILQATGERGQAEALAGGLAEVLPEGWSLETVGPADLPGALQRIASRPPRDLVVLPVDPYAAPGGPTAVGHRLYRLLAARVCDFPVAVRTTWCDDAGYVSALARWTAERVAAKGVDPDRTTLAFRVAPSSGAAPGRHERYVDRIRRSVEAVAELLDWPPERVRLDLGCDTALRDEAGVILCTLPFPSEPGRTIGRADEACPPFLSYAPFLVALRGVVLHGPQPAPPRRGSLRPVLEQRSRPSIRLEEEATLYLVGASLAGPLGNGEGPSTRYSDAGAFVTVKPSHKGVRAFLDRLRADGRTLEALLWNTCQRVECYLWLPDGSGAAERDELLHQVREDLFGLEPPGLEVNVLVGAEARHHLLRTACGLNSDLPGDRDVSAQLATALRAACSAGTAGPRARTLVGEATALADELHCDTLGGAFGVGYCAAALARVFEVGGTEPDELRHLVVGGSTTSRSVLTALRREHAVPEAQLTVAYRDHHGQMKELRSAIGSGRRLRVHMYTDDRVLSALARADVVYLGIDQPDAVFEPSTLRELRDFEDRALTILDFNSFGSLDPARLSRGMTLWGAKALDQAVATYAAILTARADFPRALAEAEDRVASHLAAATPVERPC